MKWRNLSIIYSKNTVWRNDNMYNKLENILRWTILVMHYKTKQYGECINPNGKEN
jgi:hypothetical protein